MLKILNTEAMVHHKPKQSAALKHTYPFCIYTTVTSECTIFNDNAGTESEESNKKRASAWCIFCESYRKLWLWKLPVIFPYHILTICRIGNFSLHIDMLCELNSLFVLSSAHHRESNYFLFLPVIFLSPLSISFAIFRLFAAIHILHFITFCYYSEGLQIQNFTWQKWLCWFHQIENSELILPLWHTTLK